MRVAMDGEQQQPITKVTDVMGLRLRYRRSEGDVILPGFDPRRSVPYDEIGADRPLPTGRGRNSL